MLEFPLPTLTRTECKRMCTLAALLGIAVARIATMQAQ
jgi:hypothetical protein